MRSMPIGRATIHQAARIRDFGLGRAELFILVG